MTSHVLKDTLTNLGEIILSPYDSCRLFSINLYSYALNAFTNKAKFKKELLRKHVEKAMRLMDDLVDLEIEKVDKIIESIKKSQTKTELHEVELELWKKIKQSAIDGRRTGLGVLGEADLLASLGYRYGTPEATHFSEEIHNLIATHAYRASIDLAEERGAFPSFKKDSYKESGFLKRLFNKSKNPSMGTAYFKKHELVGRRNIGLLTIAPTGSTALLTQTSSGLEPLFYPYHFRKKKVEDGSSDYTIVDNDGTKWKEFTVFHKPFIDWFSAINNKPFIESEEYLKSLSKEELGKVFEDSPYYKATAQDVDYVEKVEMQGKVQKWIDHSISVTVNMPESVSKDVVGDVYMKAYETGCKGITVYRDNSRGNVLSTTASTQNKHSFAYLEGVKRPKEVKCDVHFRTNRGDDYIFFVGLIDDKPYEMFAVPLYLKTKISKSVKDGTIKRVKKGHYRFTSSDNKYVIENLLEHMTETEQNETRSISAMLRHRMNPIYIVRDVLEKFATISSFHKIAARVLSGYFEDKIEKCPQCGGKIIKTEGCMKCVDCGYAKCG